MDYADGHVGIRVVRIPPASKHPFLINVELTTTAPDGKEQAAAAFPSEALLVLAKQIIHMNGLDGLSVFTGLTNDEHETQLSLGEQMDVETGAKVMSLTVTKKQTDGLIGTVKVSMSRAGKR
jgi:hypothetical protein